MGKIDIKNVTLEFPGVRALDQVSFEIGKGDVIGLCGENGAGKSTLAKIIAGVWPHGRYDGTVTLDGEELNNQSTLDAEKVGIAIVHQELNQINDMTVAENIFLTGMPTKRGFVDDHTLMSKTKVFLDEVGLDVSPDTRVRDLSMGYRQLVEIAKAISKEPDVLIFDESSSMLSENEIQTLFRIIRDESKKGTTMIYVSHKLDEIFEVCTHVSILKDGKYVGTKAIAETNKAELIRMMIGRELQNMYPEKPGVVPPSKTSFEIKNWRVKDPASGKQIVHNINFSARPGEILGFYGLVGAGRTETLQSIYQGKQGWGYGDLYIKGKKVTINEPADAIKNGMVFLTEDRKKTGLILEQSVESNLSLPSLKAYAKALGIIDENLENQAVDSAIDDLSIKVASKQEAVKQLSGGNQQKVCIGKWLIMKPEIFILDEPTVGIDVGTKSEIYTILRRLANEGMTVVVISSEMPEIIGLCDRVLIMHEGEIRAELSADELDEEMLLKSAIGGDE